MQVMFYFSFFCEDFLCFREMMASANCPRGTTKNAIYKEKKTRICTGNYVAGIKCKKQIQKVNAKSKCEK